MSALLAAVLVLGASPSDSVAPRLAGLARAWGQVKYVHPAMATSPVDWDAALIRAIPAVERASSDHEYREAIGDMLAELDDPVTRVLEKDREMAIPPRASARFAVGLETINADTAMLTVRNEAAHEPNPKLRADTCTRFDEAAGFERLVVDLRSPSGATPGWHFSNALLTCAARLLDRDVTLAPARFLRHGFYMMQSVSGGPGGGLGPWDSGLEVVSSGVLRGVASRAPQLVFIVGRGTPDIYPLLMGLQAHGMAQVVQEGDLPAAGVMVKVFEVDEGLAIAVRHGEWLRSDGGGGFHADVAVPVASGDGARQRALALLDVPRVANGAPHPLNSSFAYSTFVENDYSETLYPDWRYRLLALFRLYNAIEYFFPYKELMDHPWRDTLVEYVPRMIEAGDAAEYALTVAELATRIQDSHVTLASPVLDVYFGTHRPPVRVDLVEGQTIVTEVAPDLAESGLDVGDVVVSVDGEDAAARRQRLARYLPASTRGRLDNKIDTHFLLGPQSRPAAIEVRGDNGALRRVSASRTLEGLAPRSRVRSAPVYSVIAHGHGYVDLQRLELAEVDGAFRTIRNTPATILDIRGYPSSGARAFVARLGRPGTQPTMIGGTPRYGGAHGSFWVEEEFWTDPEGSGERYEGRLAVLADGSTQSAAEHIGALIRSVAAVTFIGSRTSGANGGVTRTILPGGIVVNFTGQSVRHADGSQLQRVGIVPDVEAHLTLRGVREGRDDVLECAVDYLDRAG